LTDGNKSFETPLKDINLFDNPKFKSIRKLNLAETEDLHASSSTQNEQRVVYNPEDSNSIL
tara:strand:- start:416 stop:598 length:183 start_codon:yes stop_codon:yes gene_type:complete